MGTQFDNVYNLFTKLESTIPDQTTPLEFNRNGPRPHAWSHAKVIPSHGPSTYVNVHQITINDDTARIIDETDGLQQDRCPQWILDKIEGGRNDPLYHEYIHPCLSKLNTMRSLNSRIAHTGSHTAAIADIANTADTAYTADYKPNRTHQYLSETELKDASLSEMDNKHGRPTRTTLLRARLACDRVPINVYDLHRERVEQLARLKANRIVVMNLDEMIELYTHENRHAFLTGARYNRSKYVDAKCIDRWGIYMLRDQLDASFVVPSLSRIMHQLEALSPTIPPPPPPPHSETSGTPDSPKRIIARTYSAPAMLHQQSRESVPDDDVRREHKTSLNIKGTSVTNMTSAKVDQPPKSVLPSVSGISLPKMASPQKEMNGEAGATTPNTCRSHHVVSLEDCLTKKSYPSRPSSAVSDPMVESPKNTAVVVSRRRKRRVKPVMVDRAMNFPPTASEADSTDLLILGKVATESRRIDADKFQRETKVSVDPGQPMNVEDNWNNNNKILVEHPVILDENKTGGRGEKLTDEERSGAKDLHRESTGLDSMDVQLSDSVDVCDSVMSHIESNMAKDIRANQCESKSGGITESFRRLGSASGSRPNLEGESTTDEWNTIPKHISKVDILYEANVARRACDKGRSSRSKVNIAASNTNEQTVDMLSRFGEVKGNESENDNVTNEEHLLRTISVNILPKI